MEKPYTLSWSKLNATADQIEYQEISDGEILVRLNSYSEAVLDALRKSLGPEAGYNEAAVKYLSNDLSTNRRKYVSEAKVKVANLYGCFLGTCIVQTYKGYCGRWVKWNGDLGVLLTLNSWSQTKITFPISRSFKHIERGDECSIYSYFMAIPEFVISQPST